MYLTMLASSLLNRLPFRSARPMMWAFLGIALLSAAADLPARWASTQSLLLLVRLWPQPDAQNRPSERDVPFPYDMLRSVDTLVPKHETVLLVTPGRDVATEEYVTFHRALYFLAPRPIWWMAPSPSDGTWRSRWWISAPITPDSVRALASEKRADYILVYKPEQPLLVGTEVSRWRDGYLLRLEGPHGGETNAGREQMVSGMFWPLQLLAALAAIMLLGSAVVAAARRLGYSMGALESLGMSWSLGAGLTTVLMLWLSAVGLSLTSQVWVLTLAAVAWALWNVVAWSKRGQPVLPAFRKKSAEPPALPPTGRVLSPIKLTLRGLLLLFLAVQIAFVAISAVGRPLQVWDSWANWGVKSRIIFLDDAISPAIYADPSRTVLQPDYPLLFPLTQAWIYKWVGAPDDRLAGIVSILFYVSLLSVLYAWLRREGVGVSIALAATAVVATVFQVEVLASIVFSEGPLLGFTTFAGTYLLRWLNTGSSGALLVGAVSAGLLPWTKREGGILLFALVAAILITNLRSRRAWVGVGATVLGAALLSGPWWAFVAANHVVNAGFSPVTLSVLRENISRWQTIQDLTTISLLGAGFSYIWPAAAIGGALLLIFFRPSRSRTAAILPVMSLLYVFATASIFFFSSYVPYEQHVLSSIDRLLVQMVPLLVVWVVYLASSVSPEPLSEAQSSTLETAGVATAW